MNVYKNMSNIFGLRLNEVFYITSSNNEINPAIPYYFTESGLFRKDTNEKIKNSDDVLKEIFMGRYKITLKNKR